MVQRYDLTPVARTASNSWQILQSDEDRPKKQRHTAKRIFQRLKEEHGFGGKYTIVKDYVRQRRTSTREMFVPLVHPPGHGQADF